MVLIGIALVGAWLYSAARGDAAEPEYMFGQITRGELHVTISATGTVEPEETVDVGAQVGGKILSFGNDLAGRPVDYRSEVGKDSVLAKIDDALYRSDLEQASAQLKRAQAALAQAHAKLKQSARDWGRAKKIGPSDALSQTAYDNFEAVFETSQALVKDGEAQVALAAAAVARAERNLAYCTSTLR